MSEQESPKSWADMAIGLYDKLTGRNAEITYEAENLEIWVPNEVGEQAVHTRWKVNGVLKVRTRDANP